MKKILRGGLSLVLILCLLLPGCGRKVNADFACATVSDPDEYSAYNSGAAFAAFEIDETDEGLMQSIYVWDNGLCRDLCHDLKRVIDYIPDSDRIIIVESGVFLKICRTKVEYEFASEAVRAIIFALIPEKCMIRADVLYRELNDMVIRLSMAGRSTEREAVVLKTVSDCPLRLDYREHGVFHQVFGTEELIAG